MDSSPKKEKILIIEANAEFAARVGDELKKHGRFLSCVPRAAEA